MWLTILVLVFIPWCVPLNPFLFYRMVTAGPVRVTGRPVVRFQVRKGR